MSSKTKFIWLTYYEHNRTFPEKSGTTGKRFLFNVDDISTVTPYDHSTKIVKKYTGVEIEVIESLVEIWELIKGPKS